MALGAVATEPLRGPAPIADLMAQLAGAKCTCGREVFPARRYCPDCQRPMTGAKLPSEGVVESWTSIEVPPADFDPPVRLALVRLIEGTRGKPPLRVLARTQKAVEVGAKVALQMDGDVLWAA